MIGLAASAPAPDGTSVHIWAGSAGGGTAPSIAKLVVEDNGHSGIAILSAAGDKGVLYFGDGDDTDIAKIEYDHSNNRLSFGTNASTHIYLSSVGNLQIGDNSNHGTTVGTDIISIFNGTAPVGTLSNGASFFAASGQMRVIQADGTATDVSPHNPVTGEWWHNSEQTVTGKHTRIHMERLVRFLDNHFGTDFLEEWMEETNGE